MPAADLRSVWVLKPEDAASYPVPSNRGVYIEANVAEFVIAAGSPSAVYLAKFGKWYERKGPRMRFESAIDAMNAARAAVAAAKKEAE